MSTKSVFVQGSIFNSIFQIEEQNCDMFHKVKVDWPKIN